jgi:hypothetical protein
VANEHALFCQPIADAPVTRGVEYGPCLLGPGLHGEEWTIGRWNGAAWCDNDGIPLDPVVFMILVPVATVLAALGRAR